MHISKLLRRYLLHNSDGFYYNKPGIRKAMFSYFSNAGRVTAAFMHARLIREHTVAEGYDICDYRYVGDREK